MKSLNQELSKQKYHLNSVNKMVNIYMKNGDHLRTEPIQKDFNFGTMLFNLMKSGYILSRLDILRTIKELNADGEFNIKSVLIFGNNPTINRKIGAEVLDLGHYPVVKNTIDIQFDIHIYDIVVVEGAVYRFGQNLVLGADCTVANMLKPARI